MSIFFSRTNSVWADGNFRRFLIIDSLESLAIGIVTAVFPLLVSQRFGSKDELIIAQTLLIVPRVIFAPLAGRFLFKKGPVIIVRLAMLGLAGIFLAQSLVGDYLVFKGTIVLRAIVGMGAVAGLLTLKAWVVPEGKNIDANGVYLATSRTIFFGAPFLVKMGESYLSTVQYFYIASSLILVGAGLTLNFVLPTSLIGLSEDGKGVENPSYFGLFRLFKQKKILFTLFMPLFGTFIINGIFNSFLLWLTVDVLDEPKTTYTALLTAKGGGYVLSSFLAPYIVKILTKRVSMERLYLYIRLVAISSLLSLVWVRDFYGIMVCLGVSNLPKAMAAICFFTLLERHLTKKEQAMVHTLTKPLCLLFGLFGMLIALMYTHGYFTLMGFWLVIVSMALGLALFSLRWQREISGLKIH